MEILIPSLGRPTQKDPTLAFIPSGWRHHTHLVVQAHEEDRYRPIASMWDVRLLVLPPDIKRLPATRRWLQQWLIREGVAKSVQMDDDLWFYRRIKEGDWHLRNADEVDMRDLLGMIDYQLDTYAHVGVSGREGQNTVLANHAECTRYMRVLAYRTDAYKLVDPGRMEDDYEDFDTNLQLLELGYPSLVLYNWAQGQKKTQSPGGCANYRTNATHDAAARRLQAYHPDYVKLVEKHNKTDADGFGVRTEVVVSWKKAYKDGSEKRSREAGHGPGHDSPGGPGE